MRCNFHRDSFLDSVFRILVFTFHFGIARNGALHFATRRSGRFGCHVCKGSFCPSLLFCPSAKLPAKTVLIGLRLLLLLPAGG